MCGIGRPVDICSMYRIEDAEEMSVLWDELM